MTNLHSFAVTGPCSRRALSTPLHAPISLSVTVRARPEINALIRSKISELYQGVKVIEFDHLSPDDP